MEKLFYPDFFNDVFGPIMQPGSSGGFAGTSRIGRIARYTLKSEPAREKKISYEFAEAKDNNPCTAVCALSSRAGRGIPPRLRQSQSAAWSEPMKFMGSRYSGSPTPGSRVFIRNLYLPNKTLPEQSIRLLGFLYALILLDFSPYKCANITCVQRASARTFCV